MPQQPEEEEEEEEESEEESDEGVVVGPSTGPFVVTLPKVGKGHLTALKDKQMYKQPNVGNSKYPSLPQRGESVWVQTERSLTEAWLSASVQEVVSGRSHT